jgi:hypothetical protein
MALVLLTFLGLTLAASTSTELQISTNYRYAQQALYNAEAGIDVGRRYLREVDWRAVLPPARGDAPGDMASPPDALVTRNGPEGEGSRNFEAAECDDCPTCGNIGYGVVLDDPNEPFPFQNTSTIFGQTLNGTFTVWVRRELITNTNYDDAIPGSTPYLDSPNDLSLVMTVEGTAPYAAGAAVTQFALTNRAIRYLEVSVDRIDPGDCENRSSQEGAGPGGSGFDQCDPIGDDINVGGTTGSDTDTGAQ